MLSDLADAGIVELELNQGKGWRGSDLSFLAQLPNLKSFEIFDFNIKNIAPIHGLHELRRLGVTTYCSTPIHFSSFPELDRCALEWRPKAGSLFDCTTLTNLFVNRYKARHTDEFARLLNLESLAILNAPVQDLTGLRSLKRLRSLRLAGLTRLSSLNGVDALENLEELDINTCRRITSIEEIGSLAKLRTLYLNNGGDIDSLKPLDMLRNLESVGFYGSTKIVDGDMSPLQRQVRLHLSHVSYRNRRHYSRRREEFGVVFSG